MATRVRTPSLILAGALLVAALALWLVSIGNERALAAEPVQNTNQFSLVVEDEGEHCGFPIRWEISGTVRQTLFFEDGELVRVQAHFAETNVLTNLDTGKTVEDNPTFNQRVYFEEGVLQSVETDGIFVNARGDNGESVMDVGRVVLAVISATERVLIFEGGQHPFRDLTVLDLEPGLAAFCDVLS
ncbi:MAG TPA: hypothetical protein VFZ41_02140 [Solirubrobacterales bacterium]